MRQLALDAPSSTCCHSCLRACSRPKLHSARYKQFTSAYTQRVHTNKRRCHRRVSAQTDNGGEQTPPSAAATPVPRDDDVLPDSLGDALQQASDATALAIEKGANRCIVEILLPEFWDPASGPVFAEEGDQQRFWKLTRRFIDSLAQGRNSKNIKAIYPDMGVAAMLKNQWPDAGFNFASLSDRKPVSEDDDLIVLAAPDPQGLEAVKKATAAAETVAPIILFNPRLASGDAGVGLNVRRLTKQFTSTFTTSYSLRPVADVGSVFRRYPGQWQVFVEDPSMEPGRYLLAAERPTRPAGEALDAIIEEALGLQTDPDGGGKGIIASIGSTISSLQRFSRSLSR
ncbi:hypothetical protein WJX79_010680 [Trebouxia sp. C0005]|nr:MAG: hypothetical protein FRX49_00022 [Trebouxia sp. A1-2]